VFASLDPAVAAARGIPVRALGVAFLFLVGLITAEASQIIGALLVLGLVAAPAGAAGAAHRLTGSPWLGLILSAGIAVGATCGGLALAYAVPALPPSFAILACATAAYVIAATSHGRYPLTVTPNGRAGTRRSFR
jgi:zinc/manganese transport system permease protein